MVEVAVNTRKQGIDEELLQLKEQLRARRDSDREHRLQKSQQQQNQDFNTKPSLNNVVYTTPKQQHDDEMRILYPVLPQMQNTQTQQQTMQNLPGVENPQAKEQVRQADLRAVVTQKENNEARTKHGAEMTIIYADDRIHKSRQNPGKILTNDELNKGLKKQEKYFNAKMEKFSPEKMEELTPEKILEIYYRLTGREKPITTGHVVPKTENIQLSARGKKRREEKLKRTLSRKKQRELEEMLKERQAHQRVA